MARQTPRGRSIRKTFALLLAPALLLCACLTGSALDWSQSLSITVGLGDAEYAEELKDAGLVCDLYQLASAVERPGEDGFRFQLLMPYTELPLDTAQTQEDFAALAGQAGLLALSEGTPLVSGAELDRPIETTDSGSPLPAGLYLLLVHLRGETDYAVPAEDGRTLFATSACAGDYRYFFSPQLLSIPTKESTDGAPVTTDQPGEWIYELSAVLKAEREPRFGALEIVKTLQSCSAEHPGLFIFSVEAELDGESVYSDVVCLCFDAAGQQSIRIERLPVGATVTVSEVYEGVSYALVSVGTQSVQIEAAATQRVEFVNEYAPSPNKGGGIENTFTWDQAEGWNCAQDPAPGA